MFLYTITNKVSGTKYYGITVNPKQRWFNHCQMRHKTPLYDAMRSYGKENFVLEVINSGSAELIAQQEIELIASDPDCYNLHRGGHIGFDVTTKDEQSVVEWKAKLRAKRKGRTPAKGMRHTEETKKLCGQYGKLRWDLYGRYPADAVSLSFKNAKIKYGISKTHYYRLKRQRNNDSL
jgi:group I intron endonuclease